ncbi:HET-domain-containing protein, partial [Ophiobolus disseminans]
AESTADVSCWKLVQKWLHDCVNTHTLCRKTLPTSDSMANLTRLIDLQEPSAPRLVETTELASKDLVSYATLSHRWQAENMPKLTRSNLDGLKQSIQVRIFPHAFSDALDVCRRLKVRYIWINALCTIQDDLADWETESALMGQVYHNAFCSIGASAAANHPVGLFIHRDSRQVQLCPLRIRRKEFDRIYGGRVESRPGKSRSTLLRRGWALQERMLSKRSIYFDVRLRWECFELSTCEMFPTGAPIVNTFTPRGDEGSPFRTVNLLFDDHRYRGTDIVYRFRTVDTVHSSSPKEL